MSAHAPHLSTFDEARRLETLSRYGIMDTMPEDAFEEVVLLAAQLCETPISTITLIDESRQWFKARVGLALKQTSREIAFCAHTIMQAEPMIIPNALLDSRFVDNPLVLGPPHLIFYAGFPLISTDGCAVGTLTVMDTVPRTLSPELIFALKVLAHQVVAQFELRSSLHELSVTHADLLQKKMQLEVRVEERTKDLAQANVAQAHAEFLYQSLWETTSDAIIVMDTQSIIHYANASTERIFGHPLERVIGTSLALLQPARLRLAHLHGLQNYVDSGWKQLDWRATETSGLHADGSELPIEIAFTEMTQDGRRLFVGFIRDISERKRIEAALLEEKERAQITLRSIGDGVITTDPDGLIAFLNPMAEQLTGWLNEDAYGHHHDAVLKLTDELTGKPITISNVLIGSAEQTPGAMPPTTLLERRVDGEILSIEGSVAKMFGRQDEFAGWVIAFRDVSLSRQLVAQLSYQASHDPLTGLVNRTEFDRRLRIALESAVTLQRHHSMLYMDLDQFKVVNDTRGHIAGDELLKQLCGLLLQGLRATDTLARLGGDEFGVLLENCGSEAALQIAEKLRQVVADFTFIWEAQAYSTTVSIGHVHFHDRSLSLADILSKADEACYMAKEKGRNRVHTFQPSDEVLAQRHGEMEWVRLIREAIEEQRLVLYSQQIYAVNDSAQQSVHVEILLRMRDRDGQLVPPMAFIPAAERYNLMPAIDRWIISSVFAHIAKQIQAGVKLGEPCFAINLSGTSMGDPLLADFIQQQLELTGIPPTWICFEITETSAIANLSSAVKLIDEVKQLGCLFALDDFGSGMSSFAYLKHLPVDFLKIDGSFVRDIATDPIDRAMVASINEIGHLMGLRTIAEFVENDAILHVLRDIGVDYAQGYGLAQPEPFL